MGRSGVPGPPIPDLLLHLVGGKHTRNPFPAWLQLPVSRRKVALAELTQGEERVWQKDESTEWIVPRCDPSLVRRPSPLNNTAVGSEAGGAPSRPTTSDSDTVH